MPCYILVHPAVNLSFSENKTLRKQTATHEQFVRNYESIDIGRQKRSHIMNGGLLHENIEYILKGARDHWFPITFSTWSLVSTAKAHLLYVDS